MKVTGRKAAAGVGTGVVLGFMMMMGAGPSAPPTGGGEALTANIWIDNDGGTCVDNAGEVEYASATACTPDGGFDAADAGDVVRIKAGTYASPAFTGDKVSEIVLIGEGDGDDVIFDAGESSGGSAAPQADCVLEGWSAFCAEADNMTIENVTIIVWDPNATGGASIDGDNVTFRNVHIRGADLGATYAGSSIGVQASNFLWDGGSLGRTDDVETLTCSHSTVEPIWLQDGADGTTIQYVEVGRYATVEGAGTPIDWCGPPDFSPHMEAIRFEDADNVTFIGNHFHGPTGAGSGYIFTSSDPDNITFINNIFEDRECCDNGVFQDNGGTATDWAWYYNTFLDPDDAAFDISGTNVWVGNYGYDPMCGTSNSANVAGGSGACSGWTYIGATDLGVDADGKLELGSPALEAGETPGAADECTNASTVNSLDIDENARPQGTDCDAGADERP